MDSEYRSLLNLLNDENEQSASLAMAELLRRDQKKLEPVLRKLQETADPGLRKRIHQLQSAMVLRRRRKLLTERLSGQNLQLLEGLFQLHLLWFDNDSPASLRRQWKKLFEKANQFKPDSLEALGMFMRKMNFVCAHKDDLEPDHLCIGSILDDSPGADFILCAVASLLAAQYGLTLRITQSAETDFILIDRRNNVLVPAQDWNYVPQDGKQYAFQIWTAPMLLRYAAALLFTGAVSGDSFRYVYTIGSCLAGTSEARLPLPYPYGGGK